MDPMELFSGKFKIKKWKYFLIQHTIEQWNSLQQEVLDDNDQLTKKIWIHKHKGVDEAPSQEFAKLLAVEAHIIE